MGQPLAVFSMCFSLVTYDAELPFMHLLATRGPCLHELDTGERCENPQSGPVNLFFVVLLEMPAVCTHDISGVRFPEDVFTGGRER